VSSLSKKNGYSLCFKKDGFVATSVSSLAEGGWRVESLHQGQGAVGSSTEVQNFSKNTERLTMMIPGVSVRTSLISLPRLKKKETSLAVTGWVAREESSPADQWSVSWRERQKAGEEKADKKDIFLLYESRENVDSHISAAQAWGASPSRMLPDFMVLDAMFRRHHSDSSSLKAWNIVFIGKEDHFLCVSTEASLLLTRPLPADLSDGADAQEYLDRLATDVDRSIFFARQTEFNPDIQKIIVCGDSEQAHGLVEKLKEETTVPAEFWDVADLFQMETGKLDSTLLLPAMAAALAPQKNHYNLLPHQSGTLLGPVALRRLVLAASTAAVALVPILVVGGLLTARIQDRYLDRARQQLEQSSVRADEAAEIYKAQRVLMNREELMLSFTIKDADYAGVLLHLASLTPEQIIYQDLRLKESREGQLVLHLSGQSNAKTVAEAQQSFLTFQQALNSSSRLVAMGEPRKLVISSPKVQDAEIKRVDFIMEYRVQLKTQPASAVASVVANAER